jgi:hypothetical protein
MTLDSFIYTVFLIDMNLIMFTIIYVNVYIMPPYLLHITLVYHNGRFVHTHIHRNIQIMCALNIIDNDQVCVFIIN